MSKIPKIEYKVLTPKELENYIHELYNESIKKSSKRKVNGFMGHSKLWDLLIKEEIYKTKIENMTLESYEKKNLLRLIDSGKFDLVDGLITGIKERQRKIKNKKWIKEQSTFIIPSDKWQMINYGILDEKF